MVKRRKVVETKYHSRRKGSCRGDVRRGQSMDHFAEKSRKPKPVGEEWMAVPWNVSGGRRMSGQKAELGCRNIGLAKHKDYRRSPHRPEADMVTDVKTVYGGTRRRPFACGRSADGGG